MGCGSSSAGEDGAGGEFDDAARLRMKKNQKVKADRPEDDDFFEVETAQGQEFMASKPWMGQVKEPDNAPANNPAKPDENYSLEYVYGYRSQDSRQNVYFNKEGNATYMTAALGVILDHNANTQKFFGGGEVDDSRRKRTGEKDSHNDDILGLAISPCRGMAVTGQRGNVPLIFCWDACTGEKKARVVLDRGARGINAVAFSGDG